MPMTYVHCFSTDRLAAHDLFRLTFVPANAFVGAVLSRWPDACYGVFNRVAGGYGYPIQGAPTILDLPTGEKACVFDVKVNTRGVGAPIAALARLANDAYPTTALVRVERLTVNRDAIGPEPRAGATQTATGETVAEQVAATSVGASVRTAATWVIVALVIVAVIVVATKVPKLA